MDDMVKVNVRKSTDQMNTDSKMPDTFVRPEPIPAPSAKKPKNKKPIALILLALVAIGAIGYGGYWYYAMQNKKEKDAKTQIESLSADKQKLEKELSDAKNTDSKTSKTQSSSDQISKLTTVKDAISSKNTAALEALMAPKVTVIIAASEGIGERTPAQAVQDLDYVTGKATNPWDFALSLDTLTKYRSGDYGSYFPIGAFSGKSANKYVVSFLFNDEGKIIAIFMTNSESVLL